MKSSFLSIGRLERRMSTGQTEHLLFEPGVNLLVGRPNTGKTKWLQTLDYLLGDPDENPFEAAEEEGLAAKYSSAGVELFVSEDRYMIERRWRETGAKTKIYVNDEGMSTKEFQRFLMEKLEIPLINFPRGNPMSGQTWPEFSFRMMLRHIYRRQHLWSGIADQQPDGEQHACLLQFLGLGEHLYSKEYGRLVALKMQVEELKTRREQFGLTLNELARDVISEPGLSVGVNVVTVRDAEKRITQEMQNLHQRRTASIINARDKAYQPEKRAGVERLGEERATLLVTLEELRRRAMETAERLDKLRIYRNDLENEIERMARAEDAGELLADLKITHCPACDQPVDNKTTDEEKCFLCHQHLHKEPLIEELGAVRLRFERDRLTGEFKEMDELLKLLDRDAKRLAEEIALAEERLHMLENKLTPARQAVSALVQEEVSAIDMALGELNERQRQISRVSAALALAQKLTEQIKSVEREIEPLQAIVDEATRAIDFQAAANELENGMNAYLTAINGVKPGVWRHSPVMINISRSGFTFYIGSRRWQAALGGTDALYFLMAYHYGLLTLTNKPTCHYPGLVIIDVPGEFAGEAVEDKENFIIQPFLDLLKMESYEGSQVIITGASFKGLEGAHRIHLKELYVA